MTVTQLLLDGVSTDGAGPPLEIENPATQEVIATVREADDAQVRAACTAARAATGAWQAVTALERAEHLHAIARELRARSEEFAALMTAEGGKPLLENRDEIEWCAACCDFYAELARVQIGRVLPPIESQQLAMVVKEPLGVVAAIVPWNYPLLLLFWKLAPALAAGNTVIVKPSELTPLSTLALTPLFADLPAGTVQILVGGGAVGAALVANPEVDGIAFTGSTATGKAIAHVAIDRMARVNLEMGGKDAMLICDDLSDEQLQIAAEGTAWAAFLNAGQVCTSTERIFVPRSRADDFVTALVAHTQTLRVGDPTDPQTDVGPMVSGNQRQKALDQLQAAASAGATVHCGGTDGGFEHGYYFIPAVVSGVAEDAGLIHEETFAPIAPVVFYDELDDAVHQINASRYGLGANIYTADLERALSLTRAIKAGTVWCNDPLTDNDAGPFGGFRQSGLGRELGPEGLEAFQETKHIHLDPTIARKDWWYPYGR